MRAFWFHGPSLINGMAGEAVADQASRMIRVGASDGGGPVYTELAINRAAARNLNDQRRSGPPFTSGYWRRSTATS